ncbi:MAG: LpqB family beta-propeller domain-containing protein [Trueperella sp.]|uniref:LpqB family beta-propeller domain-containing protein n=1 Tax=Trueperella TaxID=1069494 RepID=UPI0025E2DC11|nr:MULTISPECIES: LpqB family beta-propeller domain-containing protein [Trueperella]MCI7305480.1 LpqB family beta-propeller domain-containing protein [Trueperella sp.]MDY5402740.1 LpqB family beta-propeller domain-containing protein [Trueperella sp.]
MKKLAIVLVMLVLAGCASLPTSGAPQQVERPSNASGAVVLDPQGPTPGSTPEALVSDFLRAAAAGLSGDFSVARQFLTPEAAARWNPSTEVRIYQDAQNPSISSTRTGAIRVSASALATLDENGRYTEAAPDAILNSEFSLTRDAKGEWRIAVLDQGVVVPSSVFASLYSETTIYFLTPDRGALVPEARWYLTATQATSAVQALLQGPSSWLSPAAHSAIPSEASLTQRGVRVTDGVAQVDLSSEVASMAASDMMAMEAQISGTLLNLPGIQDVKLTSGGAELEFPSKIDLSPYPYATYTLAGLANGSPATVSGGEVSVEGSGGSLGLTMLATSYNEPVTRGAALGNGGKGLYSVFFDGSAPVQIASGDKLVGPSIDSRGWVWSGEAASKGELIAVDLASGESKRLSVPYLQGLNVRSLAVSREGSRMAIVTDQKGEVQLNAVSILRDASGTPIEIGAPVRFGQSLVDITDVAWVSEVRLAAVGRQSTSSTSSIHVVGIGTPTTSLAAVDNVVNLTAGRGTDTIVIQDDTNRLFSYDGAGWRLIAEGVASPALPG